MSTTYRNRFGFVLGGMAKPIYVMQMARSKDWTAAAQRRTLLEFRDHCEGAIERCNAALRELDRLDNHEEGQN